MAAPHRLSEELTGITVLEAVDIGGTNVTSEYLPVKDADRIFAYAKVGETNTDPYTTVKLLQATTAGGAGAKDLTTSGAGATYDYDNTAAIIADDDDVILEARAPQMDVNNGFNYVALYMACAANGGTDTISAVLMVHAAQHERANRPGATVTVYPSASN